MDDYAKKLYIYSIIFASQNQIQYGGAMMIVDYQLYSQLPPMAWLAHIESGVAKVIYGNHVEIKDNFFVEGAWDGDFSEGKFSESEWFCGSGGRIEEDRIIFSTPSHVTSALFVAPEFSEGVLVSNSFHLLCTYADYKIDPQFLNYETDFNTILLGIEKYKQDIHLANGKVNLYYFRTISVSDDLQITIEQKKKTSPFTSFEDYKNRIISSLKGMVKNATDNRRKVKYDLVTTISKGYDAPCCATLAKECGCNTAVTFEAKGKYEEDSGVEIAQKLGYQNIIERNADAYLLRNDLVEAEQIASGSMGCDLCFVTFEDTFRNRLVFTGDRGDSVWERENPICNDTFTFNGMLSHVGISEWRLWVGYISVPLPLYGASAWTSIQRISQSDEMKPWSLGNNYDRPIPRRICEEAGLERNSFGTTKHGAGFTYHFDWGGRIKKRMSPEGGASFAEFVANHKKPHPLQIVQYFWKTRKIYLRKLGLKLSDKSTKVEKSLIPNATAARYLFPWASEVVQEKYRSIIKK